MDLHKYCYKAQCESYVYTENASKNQRSGPRVNITNPRTDECFVRTSFSNPQRFFFSYGSKSPFKDGVTDQNLVPK